VQKLLQARGNGITPRDIGIITPYRKQVKEILRNFNEDTLDRILYNFCLSDVFITYSIVLPNTLLFNLLWTGRTDLMSFLVAKSALFPGSLLYGLQHHKLCKNNDL